jgi:signal peptidase I
MNGRKTEIFSWTKSVLFAIAIAFICRQFLFSPIIVSGQSMMPTLQDNNKMVITKVSKIERFDVIVFHAPDSDEDYIKRVIGLPGDTVEERNDNLYINGKKYKEPYLPNTKGTYTKNFTLKGILKTSKVPKDTYFVMGDNRPLSKDSRLIGFIPIKSVIGEAKYRYFPITEIGFPN